MKNVITSLLLVFSLLIGMVSFTACTITNGLGNNSNPGDNNTGNEGDQNNTQGGSNQGDGDQSNDDSQSNNQNNNQGNDNQNNNENREPLDVDLQNMLEGKYSDFEIPREKLQTALFEALKKVDYALPTFSGDNFPSHSSVDNVYSVDSNLTSGGWNTGFWTGILWHAYELKGYYKYIEAANGQIPSFYERIENLLGVNHHDMGFLYIPSCVAAYKITGNVKAKEAALMAADHLISRYHEESGFIQAWGNVGATDNYRLIVDCLLNIPLLYWATEVTGDQKYWDIAYTHFSTTMSVCYREDGSTYHTYYFDYETNEPLYGATHQGASDESTWARGQAWGMYGPMLTYKYVQDEKALTSFISAANYFLTYLPSDYVPYWDLSFGDGAYEPKDSSSAAIAVCAMLEAIKYMDENDPQRRVFVNACNRIMNSLIDSYTTKNIPEANGLLLHGTYSKPHNNGVDEMTIWGDYFYMEALHRMLDPEWELYW